MFVITKNGDFILQGDGAWGWRGLSEPKVFLSRESAREWIEQDSLPEDFVAVQPLLRLLADKQQQHEKHERNEEACLRRSKFIALPNPIEFFSSADSPHTFGRFSVTHTLICDGEVSGVLGATDCDHLPFYCYSGEEYHYAFEHYSRRQPRDPESDRVVAEINSVGRIDPT